MVLRIMYLPSCAVPINRAKMKHASMLLKSRDGGSAGHHKILNEICQTNTRIHVDMTFTHLNNAKLLL